MKVIINIPSTNLIGGVYQIYNVLRLDDAPDIDYFTIRDEKEVAKLKKIKILIDKYVQYFFKIRNYDIAILNPSLAKNAFFRNSIYCAITKLFHKKNNNILAWLGGFL